LKLLHRYTEAETPPPWCGFPV